MLNSGHISCVMGFVNLLNTRSLSPFSSNSFYIGSTSATQGRRGLIIIPDILNKAIFITVMHPKDPRLWSADFFTTVIIYYSFLLIYSWPLLLHTQHHLFPVSPLAVGEYGEVRTLPRSPLMRWTYDPQQLFNASAQACFKDLSQLLQHMQSWVLAPSSICISQ